MSLDFYIFFRILSSALIKKPGTMHPKSFKSKLVAMFVVAFVCLNAGGFVCVAHCQASLRSLAASRDHCPLKKKSGHCDPAKFENSGSAAETSDSIGTNKIECCRMAFSFIAAPLEKRAFSIAAAATPVVVRIEPVTPAAFDIARQTPPPAYRGPPLDRRVERLKHCIIRI